MPRKDGPKRDDKAVKIARDLAVKAAIIAESRGVPMAEYLSDILKAPIERDWPKARDRFGLGKP